MRDDARAAASEADTGPDRAGTVVRLPNHLGDLVLALPAVAALAPEAVVVRHGLASLASLAQPGHVIPLLPGPAGAARVVRRLRAERPRRGVVLPRSFSSALLFAAGGVPERRGVDADGRRRLLTDPVPASETEGVHRAEAFWRIALGEAPPAPPVPRVAVPDGLSAQWRDIVGPHPDGPTVGVVPGGTASSRRWDPYRFATLAQRLAGQGARVVVFGGPEERDLTEAVAGTWALDAGGRTDLPMLAAALAACDVVVGNDTGSLHLAAAVGARTISLWGAGDPAETGPLGEANELIRRADLPCVPCRRNVCPRSGSGYVLPGADRECLRLIRIDAVGDAVASAVDLPRRRDFTRSEGLDDVIA